MKMEVALAMIHQEGRWLLQLRADDPRIVAPGCWGLFGGHLDPGETPEAALRRELVEELSWQPDQLSYASEHHLHQRKVHVYCCELTLPLAALQLRDGQDMVLVRAEEILSGAIRSERLNSTHPLADGLLNVIADELKRY
mgnify:CR=1 FL=1